MLRCPPEKLPVSFGPKAGPRLNSIPGKHAQGIISRVGRALRPSFLIARRKSLNIEFRGAQLSPPTPSAFFLSVSRLPLAPAFLDHHTIHAHFRRMRPANPKFSGRRFFELIEPFPPTCRRIFDWALPVTRAKDRAAPPTPPASAGRGFGVPKTIPVI